MQYGFQDAIAKVGLVKFISDLFWIGMFYHLYNQVCHEPTTTIWIWCKHEGSAFTPYLSLAITWTCCTWISVCPTWTTQNRLQHLQFKNMLINSCFNFCIQIIFHLHYCATFTDYNAHACSWPLTHWNGLLRLHMQLEMFWNEFLLLGSRLWYLVSIMRYICVHEMT